MDITHLCDHALIEETRKQVSKEKDATINVLNYLWEIERRKLYADLGHSSLFRFCLVELKYSEAETCLRISAMRTMKEHQEVREKLERGVINLTQAGQVGTFLSRRKGGPSNRKVGVENVNIPELISELAGKSTRETRKILEKRDGGAKEEVVTLKISRETYDILTELRVFLGKASEEEVITHLVEEREKEKEKQNRKKRDLHAMAVAKEQEEKIQVRNPRSRYIPVALKARIKERSKGLCEYVSPINGRSCQEIKFLEFHHLFPFAAGGETAEENLKYYCRNHNARAGIAYYGLQKIRGATHFARGMRGPLEKQRTMENVRNKERNLPLTIKTLT